MFSVDLVKIPLIANVSLYLGLDLFFEIRLLLFEKAPSEMIR